MKNNIKTHIVRLAVITLFVPLFFACTQSEGYGGNSGIKGQLVKKFYNDDYSLLIREEPAVDEDIFIMFGESDFLGDRVITSSTGAFEFPFLREGDYQLYYMSQDSGSVSTDKKTVIRELTLQPGKVTDLGVLIQYETLDYNDGTSKISGVVKKINYKNTSVYPFLEIKDITFAQEQEVYIIYGDHQFYEERIRTNYNGYFEFSNLIPGSYTVFVYSEDVTGGTEDIVISKQTTITEDGQVITLDEFTIERL